MDGWIEEGVGLVGLRGVGKVFGRTGWGVLGLVVWDVVQPLALWYLLQVRHLVFPWQQAVPSAYSRQW